ncbi:stage V sporulation protein B [Alicyclobacillus cellulosilyticus]|uniref:Stage V sporulation protein B n=1 Tax=Alicyclobacillus cellulosilyticus TaxID=1003997 RepID=A0A917NJS7_9BACL|nr:stage V sporulation protein B [Alicyclobacillus cellulosilyticus]GGJ06115.1 stage V sporulation protein B [Alicyclobacillus cellulosilyticus]
MSQRSFLHGAMVLVTASLVNRILGFIYNVFFSRLIGAEGMGLFRLVWPMTSLMWTLITAGMNVAIAKLVAEALVQRDAVRIRRIMRTSAAVTLTMAVVCGLAMWFGRGFIRSHWLTDPRAYPTFLVTIPYVCVIAIASLFRGYFQGLQDMSPPALASVVEQVVRIAAIYLIATALAQHGLAYAAAAAMAGGLLGEVCGLCFMVWQFSRRGRLAHVLPDPLPRSLETTRQTLRAIAGIAVPVTLSRLIGTAIFTIEALLIPRTLLWSGATTAEATAQYGAYAGMVWPLLGFPTLFTGALATNLVPAVSESAAARDAQRIRMRLSQAWKAAALVGFPSSVILTVLAEPLCRTVYNTSGIGPILSLMAPCCFLICLQGPLSGILQGLNHAGVAMANSLLGAVVRLMLMYWLGSRYGILGVALATSLSICLTTALYFASVYRYIGFAVRLVDTTKIAVASLALLVFTKWAYTLQPRLTGSRLLAVVTLGLAVYFVLCCAFRVITSRNVRRIPKVGPPLARLVARLPFAV